MWTSPVQSVVIVSCPIRAVGCPNAMLHSSTSPLSEYADHGSPVQRLTQCVSNRPVCHAKCRALEVHAIRTPPIRTEDNPPRRHPIHGRRTFADRVAHTDFATLIRHQPVDNLSMLPHNDFVVENIKQDIIREEDNLRSLLLNIDLHENSMDPDAVDDHPVLTQLKNSYMDRAVALARKRAQIQKAQTVASSYSASLEMPTYQRPPPGHVPPHDVLDPSKVIKTISQRPCKICARF